MRRISSQPVEELGSEEVPCYMKFL